MLAALISMLLSLPLTGQAGSNPDEEGAVEPPLTRDEFIAAYPDHVLVTFDDVATSTSEPLEFYPATIRSALPEDVPDVDPSFLGVLPLEVRDTMILSTHATHFVGQGSPPNFVRVSPTALRIDFATEVDAVGLEVACWSGLEPADLVFRAFAASGAVVASSALPAFFCGADKFASFRSDTPFRKLVILRGQPGSSFREWLIDDVRFAETGRVFGDGFEAVGDSDLMRW